MKNKNLTSLKQLYNNAKKAKVGDTIKCPACLKKHVKTTYHKIFCCNYKTVGPNNCKDNFWNFVDPEKRCRDTEYFRDVICNHGDPDDDWPEGWQGHKDYH
jgi:hypothetical protein